MSYTLNGQLCLGAGFTHQPRHRQFAAQEPSSGDEVERGGASVVFADSDPRTFGFGLDLESVARKITLRSKTNRAPATGMSPSQSVVMFFW